MTRVLAREAIPNEVPNFVTFLSSRPFTERKISLPQSRIRQQWSHPAQPCHPQRGRAVEFPVAAYHLQYWRDNRRVWQPVGKDASLALVAMRNKALALQASEQSDPEFTSFAPAPSAVTPPDKRLLADCAKTYIAEITAHKSAKTLAAYRLTTLAFCVVVTGIPIGDLNDEDFLKRIALAGAYIEDITREDVLKYASVLKNAGCSPRTVRNRIDQLQIFFHRFTLPSLLNGNDLPKYTQKKVRAYNSPELRKMFENASIDESDLLHFLLCTGAREQEAQYVCWSDVDLEQKTYTVTEHLDLGYRPKDKEEGTLPIPDLLVDALRERRKRNPITRLIFPGKHGKPNGHALRIVKRLALRCGSQLRSVHE